MIEGDEMILSGKSGIRILQTVAVVSGPILP
jgi:hypothetical protein